MSAGTVPTIADAERIEREAFAAIGELGRRDFDAIKACARPGRSTASHRYFPLIKSESAANNRAPSSAPLRLRFA